MAQVNEFNKCDLCRRILCRPVFLSKCGHSPWCQQCITIAKPKPKNCPLCGETVTGAPGRWPINAALGAALRCLFPDEYVNRPSDKQLKFELDRQTMVNKLKVTLQANEEKGDSKSDLSSDYEEKALKLIQVAYPSDEKTLKTDVLHWCECGLVCLPKFSRKQNRWFWGCPAWSFRSSKRKRKRDSEEQDESLQTEPEGPTHCGTFKWLSAAMVSTLKLND